MRRGAGNAHLIRTAAVKYPVLASLIRYARHSPYAGELRLDELVSAACAAYLRALDTYDPLRGALLPYATYPMRSQIIRDLAKARSLRSPYTKRLGRHLRHIDHDEQLAAWLAPVEYDDDEHAPEAPVPNPEEQFAAAERAALVRRLVAECRTLTPQERRVLELRWLAPRRPTLRALGHRLGLTGERIRQIETKALRKLRPGALALGLTIS